MAEKPHTPRKHMPSTKVKKVRAHEPASHTICDPNNLVDHVLLHQLTHVCGNASEHQRRDLVKPLEGKIQLSRIAFPLAG